MATLAFIFLRLFPARRRMSRSVAGGNRPFAKRIQHAQFFSHGTRGEAFPHRALAFENALEIETYDYNFRKKLFSSLTVGLFACRT